MRSQEILPHSFPAWLAFIRPKTFGIAIAPVIASISLSFFETQKFSFSVALATLLLSILMQAISNMENDLGYTERKAERNNRKGLPRATARGWISITNAKRAILASIFLVILDTSYLVSIGGWGFVIIGILSTVAAYTYMGGPHPIAYTPFGELTVLFFFGFTAVCGTYYLQSQTLSATSGLLGLALGSIASLVLAINNWRDREHDYSVKRRTLAVITPPYIFTKIIICLLILPYLCVFFIGLISNTLSPCLSVLLCIPLTIEISKEIQYLKNEALNDTLFKCVLLEVRFSLLFSIGMLATILLTP